jgi:hypothetical protein
MICRLLHLVNATDFNTLQNNDLFFVRMAHVSRYSILCGAYRTVVTRGLEPISYRGSLLNTLLHAIVYVFLHNLLNVLVQIANKMELQKIYIKQLRVRVSESFQNWLLACLKIFFSAPMHLS